jgi:hypothetical protein
VDNLYGPDSVVVVRYSYIIYHGWPDPHSACNRHYCGSGTYHSRAEDPVGLK